MKRTLLLLILPALVFCTAGCRNRANEEETIENKPFSFERAKAVEPEMYSTDELVSLIQNDTTHWKVIYYFDLLSKQCRKQLSDELAKMYASHDTTQWRFYLVAGFNWLHRFSTDDEGFMVEDTVDNFKYYAQQYRELLPSLGYDIKDLYIHYDPDWENAQSGVFTPLAKRIFYSDQDFRCSTEGTPQLFKCNHHNFIQTDLCIILNSEGDTAGRYYCPNGEYSLDTLHFLEHHAIYTDINQQAKNTLAKYQ